MADAVKLSEIRTWPATVSVAEAGRALGIGRSQAFRLASEKRFPARVLKFDKSVRVVTSSLIELLEGKPTDDEPGPDTAA